jgi:uncharacterized protein (DUF362 family)
MTVVQGGEPRALVQKSLENLGGIRRFVSRQDVVVIKPNIAWDRTPEQAANTNPDVVAEVVRQCWQAGAKRVIVTDVSCNEPRRCFQRSGIQAAARAEGAEVILPDPELYREVELGGVVLKSWPVFTPFLEADKIFNLPIAKHHGLTGVTLGMKNWYGILGGQRNRLHQQIHQSLADLASFMLPTVTLIDCYRILLRNGPTGGNLDADCLFRGQFIAFAGDGHGVHNFGILTGGSAIDILRGDLEGVEEQAGVARIEAGAEEPAMIWEIATWMEAESSSMGSLMSSQLELFALAMVCTREWK